MNRRRCLLFFLCFCFCDIVHSSSDDSVEATPYEWNPTTPVDCNGGPKGRIPWILHVRQSDYGWKQHTHRANIALAINKWQGTEAEMRKMELQLEVELTKALIRNTTQQIHENDLALFIHALIAINKNPRNFHGVDLVADLLHRVNLKEDLHPFLVLTLCNSHAVTFDHLTRIQNLTAHRRSEPRKDTELKALALKAFACAASLGDPELDKFGAQMHAAAQCLVAKQLDNGSFGNAYTTSLAVQALIANETTQRWNKNKAMEYLEEEAEIKVNLVKAYYIEMALNSEKVKYVKDIHRNPPEPPKPPQSENHYVQYTIKDEEKPEIYLTITMKVPLNSNFFHIMNLCKEQNERFNFTYYLNEKRQPMVYAVSGIPNDAEENMFWRICRQNDVDHDRHTSVTTSFEDSPVNLIPKADEHIIYWYRSSPCSN